LNAAPASRELPRRPLSTCDSNPFSTATVTFDHAIEIEELRAWLNQLPAAVLRVKGRVQTSAGWREVQRTVGTSSILPTAPAADSHLVVITHDRNQPTLNRVVRQLEALPA
jgi:G3E family GTPase